MVSECLDQNELGLASETLVCELDRLAIQPPRETMTTLRAAVVRMGDGWLEPPYRDAWERLQQAGES